MAADMVGIDDPVRMYLKEIGKVPLLNAEEEVVFAKAIELGEQIVEEPWRARRSRSGSGRRTTPSTPAATSAPSTASIATRPTPIASSARPSRWPRPTASCRRRPTSTSPAPSGAAESENVKAVLKDAKKERRGLPRGAYARWASPRLVDFSYMSVHNGDQECRDNKGLRALYDWSQELALEALKRFILAGREAEVLDEWGWDPAMTQEHLKPRNRRGLDRALRPRGSRVS